jgi:predicted nucleotidyltransferase
MASQALSEAEYAAVQRAAQVLRDAGATEVYLFGSAASGRLRYGSDIDLAIAGLPPERFFQAMALASAELDRPLSLVDLDDDTPFTRYLKSEGDLQRVG